MTERPDPLNPEQQAAVEHGDGPLLVLAGAGTGKTRVLVHRIAHLVDQRGAEPWSVLAVTFTNKAAGEMRQRLRALLGARADAMWIGTFHSTCARLLRKLGDAIGLTRSFVIFDDDDQMKLIERLLKDGGLDDQVSARTILSRLDRAKNRGVDPRSIKTGSFDDIVERVYPLYQAQLARESAVDFNDLLLKTLNLFAGASADKLRTRFRHVLVDEFQDTNQMQYDLVRRLADATRNLTVVGDDDQSIYAWRGAEPRNLLDFDRDFPDARVVKLEQNYRSTQTILDAANSVIARNRDRHAKRLWTDAGAGDPIELYAAGDERGEAYYVAQKIRQLLDDGPLSPSDFAILYRTNAQSRVLEEHLRAARVPAKVIGAVSFFERKEVKDVIGYLRLLANANADSAFERVVNVPSRGLGDTTVERLRAAAKACGWGLYEAARSAARGELAGRGAGPRKKLQGFVELVEGLADVARQGASVAETIIQVVDRSGLRARLEAEDSSEARDRLDNLAELVTTATDFDDETDQPQTIDAFLERIALAAPSDQSADRDQVVLMTIHVAKGLEWPVVFLTGLEDGVFPSLRGRDDQSEDAALEEERRLAYVGLTRARERLVICHARTRRVWGEIRVQQPSRFLGDLPAAAVIEPRLGRGRMAAAGPRIVEGNFATSRPGPAGSRRMKAARDELDQRVGDDDVPVYRIDEDVADGGLRAGDQVTHARHGRGKVVSVAEVGGEERVVVEFAGAGRMTVLARYLAMDDVN